MIVVDSSALLAIILEEAEAPRMSRALTRAEQLFMSAATLTETIVVARRRQVGAAMADLITHLRIEVVPLSAVGALAAADAYGRFGRGVHKASLNWGDCFSYSLAKTLDLPMAYVGNDFAHTDLTPV